MYKRPYFSFDPLECGQSRAERALQRDLSSQDATKEKNVKTRAPAAWLLGLSLLAAPGLAIAGDEPADPDNTKMNKQEGVTADDQSMNSQDTELARKIRASVMKDKSLSTYAHNVKIIVQSGKVTLKGPVRSDMERTTVEKKATDVVGATNVTNELTVAPK
jgi:hypothetical protein